MQQQDSAEITSQSNTLEAGRESGGGKTPHSKGTKRTKNVEKKPSKVDKQSRDGKKGSSSGKMLEL